MTEYAIIDSELGKTYRCKILGEVNYRFGEVIATGLLLDENSLCYNADYIANRTQNHYDNVIMNTGDEREGKSTWALKMALLLNPNFSLDNIAFTIDDIETLIETSNDEEIIVFDEAGWSIFALDFMNQFQRMLIRKLQVIGKRRLILLMNLPHRADLNKRIRDRRVSSWNHVFAIKKKRKVGENQFITDLDRGYSTFRLPHKSEFYQGIRWENYVASKWDSLENTNPIFWENYEKRKDEFIAEVSKKNDEDKMNSKSRDKLHISQRNTMIKIAYETGLMTEYEISDILNLKPVSITNIVRKEYPEDVMKKLGIIKSDMIDNDIENLEDSI